MKKPTFLTILSFIAVLTIHTVSAAAPIPNLVAYYPFNGNANDESGTGNNGTVYGPTLTANRLGNPSSAYKFDGVDDYIDIGKDASLKMTDGLTISAWINMASYPPVWYQNIISDTAPNEITEGPGKALRFHSKRLQFIVGGIYGWGTATYVESTFNDAMLGQWQHVVGTYDRNTVRLFLNGALVASRPYTAPLTVNSNPILIGKSGFGEFLHGTVDDVRIYNRALSQSEILELYNVDSQVIIADSVSEFSGTQGQDNWYYGYYDGPFTSSDFQLMTQFIPAFNPFTGDIWFIQNGTYWTSWRNTGGHPNGLNGNGGRLLINQWAVRRWISEVTGTITITGTLAKETFALGGDGITGHILVDGVEAWSQFIAGSDAVGVDYTIRVPVNTGSVVDFAIDSGPSDNDVNDSTKFTATISSTSTPAPTPNSPPTANAGPNQAVGVGQLVSLDGRGSSDANGDPLTYNWSLVSKPIGSLTGLVNATAVNSSFIADAPGTYIVSLVVNDGVVDSAPSHVTIMATSMVHEVVQKLGEAINTINALCGIVPSVFKNPNMCNALTNKINAVLDKVNQGLYQEAIDKLQNDVLAKTDGCAQTGAPDKNDWIKDCASQNQVYPLILQAIQLLGGML